MIEARSLKTNFAWAFVSNAFAAFCKWLLLVILAKTAPVETVGLFGLAQAIALPVSMLFSLKLQLANVTDARHEYAFGHYVAIKIATSLAALVTIGLIGIIFYPPATAWVIFVLGISYAVNEMREYFLSILQKYERMNLTAVSRFAQGILSLALFGGVFWLTQNLVTAIFGIIAARLILLLAYDLPVSAKLAKAQAGEFFTGFAPVWQRDILWRLVRLTAPLGLVAWLSTLFTSIPRLVMDGVSGRESVGYFTAMSSLLVVGTMITAALVQSVNPRLARYYVENRVAFIHLFLKFVGVNLLIGLCLILAAICFGKQILTLIFTPDYAEHHKVFSNIAVAGCLLLVFFSTNLLLTATRKFLIQVPIYAVAVVACAVSSIILIPRFDMLGAVWSLMVCYSVGIAGCLFFGLKVLLLKKDR